jgi:hypothetical protein
MPLTRSGAPSHVMFQGAVRLKLAENVENASTADKEIGVS